MKIYTRKGDGGETTLFGGERVPKDHPRVEAYGTVDELNACLGRAVGTLAAAVSTERLSAVQHDLFSIGAHLATPPGLEGRGPLELPPLPEARIGEMERWMDEAEARLMPLRSFILPCGSRGASELHVCRTVCRRSERAIVSLVVEGDPSAAFAVRYLNRLSDLLFVLARVESLETGTADLEWRKDGPS